MCLQLFTVRDIRVYTCVSALVLQRYIYNTITVLERGLNYLIDRQAMRKGHYLHKYTCLLTCVSACVRTSIRLSITTIHI